MDADENLVEVGSDSHEEVKSVSVPKPPSIEDFVVLKPISRGAFGKVYLARKKCNSRLYAVKMMKKADMVDKNMTGQMKAERDALALSKSPFIVHLFYSLQTATKVYLIMEYLIGGDVKSLLHIYGYFDQDMSVKYISEVALALDYLHRHGIIHRDLKPDNMLITNEGHIKLTDFGLSKVKLDRELSLADILTTPSLAKPKQDYFRTPGQVLSLISSLGFNTPATENKRHYSTSAAVTPMSCGRAEERKHSLCLPPRKKDCVSSPGRSSAVFSPCALPRSLTPCRLKSRIRCETLSAASSHFPSTAESEGVSPLWEWEEKENGLIHEKRLSGQALASTKGGPPAPESSRPTWDGALRALVTIDNLPRGTRGRFDSTPVAKPKKTNSDTLPGKRPQFQKAEPATSTQSELLSPVTGSSQNVVAPSLKRTFSDVEVSPELSERQAKRSDSDYNRCYKVPEESAGRPTGLTMVLSAVHLDDLRPATEGCRLAEKQAPTPSSPSAVAKNLLCELEEPLDDVFLAGVRAPANSSFAFGEERELTRNLSFDSEGSVHETSVTGTSPTSLKPDWCSKDTVSPSAGENTNWAASGPLPCTPTTANVESQKSCGFFQKEISKSSFFDSLPELACSIPKSPSFLKPKNVVAFRSYCSAIERSNASWNSRLSLGSVEAMDMSVSASYHGVASALTPMQKTTRSNSSICQTPQSMMTSQTPFRTPKSVRRGPVPVARGPILGTPDYLAPELLLEKSHDFMVDWWALGVCLFEFLTGVPPFNDETPQLVFQNILNRDIPWPAGEEELSAHSRNAIEILLTMDMTKRAGFKELRCHPLFEGLDWDNLQSQKMPFIPQPEDETDTSYFDARNNAQQLAVSGFSL